MEYISTSFTFELISTTQNLQLKNHFRPRSDRRTQMHCSWPLIIRLVVLANSTSISWNGGSDRCSSGWRTQ